MTMLPDPRRAKARKLATGAMKVWAWLSSRRTSRAIAANKALTMSVAASVAATGVAGFGVVQAQEAKSATARLAARVSTVESDAAIARVAAANLRDAVTRLDTKDAAALKKLAKQLTSTADQIHRLVATVAAMPPAPSLVPLTARVADLAKTTKDAARKAELATVAAAEQHDPEARAAATDAFAHASAARAVAEKAEKDALAADAKAQQSAIDAELAKAAAANAEKELYAPHVFHVADVHVPADQPAVLIGSFNVDLVGQYHVRLEATGAAWAYDWYVQGATVYLHGTGGEGQPQDRAGTALFTFNGPLTIDVKASASGGDDVALTNVTLTLTKTRS